MCISPITLSNENVRVRLNPMYRTLVVPCGKCMECYKRRASEWTFRLKEEAKISDSCKFLTLTYADNKLPFTDDGEVTLYKKDYQDFIKRVRYYAGEGVIHIGKDRFEIGKAKKRIKYYACGEYGTRTDRPHYHAIMFNAPIRMLSVPGVLDFIWKKGHVHVADAEPGAMRYVCNYLNKAPKWKEGDSREKEFSLMSKNLGTNFLTSSMWEYLWNLNQSYVELRKGERISLPRIFREKVFDRVEREALTIAAEEAREAKLRDQWNFDFAQESEWIRVRVEEHKKRLRNERQTI